MIILLYFRQDPLRTSAPLGGDFFTPGMRVMNEIFTNDDGTDNYIFDPGANSNRKIDPWAAYARALESCRIYLQVKIF